jgi:hypothetical protein
MTPVWASKELEERPMNIARVALCAETVRNFLFLRGPGERRYRRL